MKCLRRHGRRFCAISAALAVCLVGARPVAASEPTMRGAALPRQVSAGGETIADIVRRDRQSAADADDRHKGKRASTSAVLYRPVDPRQMKSSRKPVDGSVDFPQTATANLPAARPPQNPIQANAGMIVESFRTIGQVDQDGDLDFSWIPPSVSAAFGPNHVVEAVNQSLAVFSRAGVKLSHVTLESFLTTTVNATTYPRNGASSPRVIYDRHTSRWFIAAIEGGNPLGSGNHVVLAVSRGANPLVDLWDKYLISAGQPSVGMTRFTTQSLAMGIDDNGVYWGLTLLPVTGEVTGIPSYKIIAASKAGLLTTMPSIEVMSSFYPLTDMWGTPQPAINFDSVGASAPAWFVASSNQQFANIHYRTLNWVAGFPVLAAASSILTTPTYGEVPTVPSRNGASIFSPGDSMQAATIRNGRLWSCRNVGLNAIGGSSSPIDRIGSEWFELNDGLPAPSVVQLGRVYDTSATNPVSYFYPSVIVTGQGHALLGCSGAGVDAYLSGFVAHRLAADSLGSLRPLQTIHGGEAGYTQPGGGGFNRWGEYSSAALDPNNDMSPWTLQPYAAGAPANFWGTWAARLAAPAPSITFNPVTVLQGQTDVPITIPGFGFFDPGPGFPNRLQVSVSGAGVSVVSVNYINPNRVDITIDVAHSAPLGSRSIILTNPDGQSVASAGDLTIQSPVMCQTLFGDMNGDGFVDGADLRAFVDCYLRGSPTLPGCGCADLQRDLQFTNADIVLLKIKLLGFGSPTTACITSCPGDMNADLRFDGRDIQAFAECYRRGPFVTAGCVCADINEDNRVNDTDLFMLINMVMRVDNSTPNCQ